MIKSESLSKLAPALLAAQKNMGTALKDSKNPFFKSKYADLNSIIDAAIPALNAAGIAVLQSPDIVQDAFTGKQVSVIQTVLLHESGEYIAGSSEIVAAKSNDPQAAGSATTYARRYGLQAMITLKAEDDDGEGAMGRTGMKITSPNKGATFSGTLTADTTAVVDVGAVTADSNPATGKKKVTFSKKPLTGSGVTTVATVDTGDDI